MLQALQILDQICVVAFAVLAALAARSDWSRFIIPNRLAAAIAATWVAHAALLVLRGYPAVAVAWSAGIAAAVFLVGVGLFAANLLGGGDVKLLAAAILWVPPDFVLHFIMVVTVSGAVLGLAFIAPWFGNHPEEDDAPAGAASSAATIGTRLRRKTPYGVAIAVGCGVVALKLLGIPPIGG